MLMLTNRQAETFMHVNYMDTRVQNRLIDVLMREYKQTQILPFWPALIMHGGHEPLSA